MRHYSSCDAAKQDPFEPSVAFGADHNEIRTALFRILDNLRLRVTLNHVALGREASFTQVGGNLGGHGRSAKVFLMLDVLHCRAHELEHRRMDHFRHAQHIHLGSAGPGKPFYRRENHRSILRFVDSNKDSHVR